MHLLDGGVLFKEGFGFAHGNAGGAVHWEAVGAGADGGESDGADAVLDRKGEAASVAACEELVFAVALALLGPAIPWTIVLLPLVWLPLCLSTLGVCWMLAAAGVFFRDLGEMIGLFLTALMFMSPILYPLSTIPEAFRGRWRSRFS